MDARKRQALRRVAAFYDRRKVGDSGPLGFRRSTDLGVLAACLEPLVDAGVVRPGRTLFLDLGCADGRLNVFFSYLSRCSAGIELDEWTLEEYAPLKSELDRALAREGLPLPPENIFLFHGDATEERVHRMLEQETGFPFPGYMKLDLVAIIPDLGRRDDFRDWRVCHFPHSYQLVDEDGFFNLELFFVGYMLVMAASAISKMRTTRLDPQGRWVDDLNDLSPGVAFFFLYYPDENLFIWQSIGDKNCPTIRKAGKVPQKGSAR